MNKFLFLFAFLFSDIALAGSPCIFGGDYVKCFPSGGIKLDPGQALLLSDNDTNYIALKSANDIPTNYVLKFPSALGTDGQVLKLSGDTLDWLNPGSSPLLISGTYDSSLGSANLNSINEHIAPTADAGGSDINLVAIGGYTDSAAHRTNSVVALRLDNDMAAVPGQSAVTALQTHSTIGNSSDSITADYVTAIDSSINLTASANVSTLNQVNLYLTDDDNASATFGNVNSIAIGSNITTIDSYTPVSINPQIDHATNNLYGVAYGGTITDADSGFYPFMFSPNITNHDGNMNVYSAGGNWTTATNVQIFNDGPIIGTVDNYQSFGSYPHITTINGNYFGLNVGPLFDTGDFTSGSYNGISMHAQFAGGMDKQINVFEEGTTVTGGLDDNYLGVNLHPSIDTMTGNLTGVQVTGNAVGGTGQSAKGIQVSMTGYTGFEEVKAIDANGIVTAYVDAPIISQPNPTPVHAFNVGFAAPNSSTITGIDRFGFGPIMSIDSGNNSTLTSGAFGLGLASLGMINLLNVHDSSTLDATTGSFVAMVNVGNSGAIDTINGYTAAFATGGGSTSVSKARAYTTIDAGMGASDTWGFYDPFGEYNWMKNSLQIGGSAGSTDRVANSSVGLGILDKALYPVPMTTTTRDALTPLEGMLINNSTTGDLERYDGAAWTAVGGGGGGGIAIGDAVGSGNNGSLLYVDGSGNLGQSTTMVVGGMGEVCFGSTTCGQKVSVTGQFGITGTSSNTVIFQGSGSQVSSYTLTLPDDQAAASGQALLNDGTGVLSWGLPSLSVGSGVSGGSANQVLYIDSGNQLAGSNNFNYDGSTLGLGSPSPNTAYALDVNGDNVGKSGIHTDSMVVETVGPAVDALFLDLGDATDSAMINFNMDGGSIRILETPGVASYDLQLPSDQAASDGEALVNDGTGTLSWRKVPHACTTETNTCLASDTCVVNCSSPGTQIAIAGGCEDSTVSGVGLVGSYPAGPTEWDCKFQSPVDINAYATCCVMP